MLEKFITTLPEGVACVGIVEFNGRIIVALSNGIYYLDGDVLRPIPIARLEENQDA